MKIPLHLAPNDYSPEACAQRIALHRAMAQLNPKGWRTPRQHERSKERLYRLDSVAKLAELSGKKAIYDAVVT